MSSPGIVATKYDRLATLPYLQLSGWTQREAILIVLFMIAIYFLYAYISANLISIEPLRKSKLYTRIEIDKTSIALCRVFQRVPAC